MNKNDIKLLLILLLFLLIVFTVYFLNSTKAKYALVYHDSDLLLKIDLSIDKTYQVNGDLGKVTIEVKDNKIRVKEETSPNHLCSKQGFIDNTNQSIICLPNRIIISLPGYSDIDTEVH